MIRLRLLGPSSLERGDGTTIRSVLAQPKRFALLAYLAGAHPPGPRNRETLLGLFWPESDEDHARTALRQSLYRLRRSLGRGILTGRGEERVGVDPETLWCDTVAFTEALEAGSRQEALELYRGPLLEGFHLSGAPGFERWVDGRRSRLRRQAVTTAWELAEESETERDPVGARRWAERALELAPYDGAGVRRYLELMERLGQPVAAIRAYEAHAERLAEDLELEPAAETAALVERLRNGEQDRPGPASRESRDPGPTSEAIGPADGNDSLGAGASGRPSGAETQRRPAPVPALSPRARERQGRLKARPTPWRWLQPSSRIARRAVVGATAVTALVVAGVLARSGGPGADLDRPVRLVLADFEERTADTLVGPAVTEAVRIDLAQSPVLALARPDEVRAVLGRMQRDSQMALTPDVAGELAVREGFAGVVRGTIHAVGSGFLLTAELLEPQSGEVLTAVRETAESKDRLMAAIDRLARRFRKQLGESRRSLRERPPLPDVTTTSLQALEQYAGGVEALRRQFDYRKGTALLREAVSYDSAFAMAWRQLGIAHVNFGGARAQAEEAFAAAFAHRDRLTPIERHLTVGTYMFIQGKRNEAAAAFRQALDLQPDNTVALGNLAALNLWFLRDYSLAEDHLRRMLSVRSPPDPRVHLMMARALFAQGRIAAAESALHRHAEALGKEGNVPRYPFVRYHLSTRDYDAATQLLTEIRRARTEDRHIRGQADLLLGLVARVRGRVREAERRFQSAVETAGNMERNDQFLLRSLEVASTYSLTLGQNERGVRLLDTALAKAGLDSGGVEHHPNRRLASYYAEAGRPDRARALLAGDGDAEQADAFKEWPVDAPLGLIAYAEGRFEAAVTYFHRAHDIGQEPAFFLAPLGKAYKAMGMADSAIAVYERFVGTPWLGDYRYLPDSRYLPQVLESLALLYDSRGATVAAMHCYGSFIRLWTEADSVLQPRVERARDRLLALQRASSSSDIGPSPDTTTKAPRQPEGHTVCADLFQP